MSIVIKYVSVPPKTIATPFLMTDAIFFFCTWTEYFTHFLHIRYFLLKKCTQDNFECKIFF